MSMFQEGGGDGGGLAERGFDARSHSFHPVNQPPPSPQSSPASSLLHPTSNRSTLDTQLLSPCSLPLFARWRIIIKMVQTLKSSCAL
jgi:hypothetical protein